MKNTKKIILMFGKAIFYFKNKSIAQNPKKILIMRSGGIGDVLMSTPLIRAIRKEYPKSEITYFVGNWSRGALDSNPNIDKIFSYDDLVIINMKIAGILKIIRQIRKEKFDLCFNLEKSWHWGVLSFLFGIKTRIGFDRLGEGFAHNLAVPFDGSKYELDYYLDLVMALKIKTPATNMEIYLTKEEKDAAAKLIKKNNLKNKVIIGISPGGADNPAQQAFIKRWPIERYVELIDKLTTGNKKAVIILFGGKNDVETCNKIKESSKNKNKVLNAAGRFTLKESAALMRNCKAFITHDSGPMHLAAAAGVPLIALFGPTQPERFAPKNKNTVVVKSGANCSPCYDIYGGFEECLSNECMKSINVDDVIKIINQNL